MAFVFPKMAIDLGSGAFVFPKMAIELEGTATEEIVANLHQVSEASVVANVPVADVLQASPSVHEGVEGVVLPTTPHMNFVVIVPRRIDQVGFD